MNAVSASYALSALAYAILAGLVAFSWRGRARGALLLFASLVTSVWSASAVLDATRGTSLSTLTVLCEIARDVGWLSFLLRVLGGRSGIDATTARSLVRVRWVLFGVGLVLAVLALTGQRLFGVSGSVWVAGTFLLFAVGGLVLIEQIYRNAGPENRWAIKYLCIGLGGVFAVDFYLYADALLFHALDRGVWGGRGLVNALVMPLIMVSAARNPDWSLRVAVSRRFVFHSAALVGAGAYLLIMAAAGYYLRVFGGEWGAILQTALIAAAGILLVSILYSGTLRARVRVFLAKHFFTYKYDYRDEWLNFTRILSAGEPGQALCERVIRAMAGLVESPAGALWLSQDRRFVRAGNWNLQRSDGEVACDDELIRFLDRRAWVIALDEFRMDPATYDGLKLPAWLTDIPDAWLVVPLPFQERTLGFLVLAKSLGKVGFNWEVSDLLKTAARQAASHLAQMQASDALVVARQFESFNRTTAFVVHDLKNLIAQLSLLTENAQKHKSNPEFIDDMIATVESSVARMNRLLGQLRAGWRQDDAAGEVDIGTLLTEVIASKGAFRLKPTLDCPAGLRVHAESQRLARVLGNVVQNALEATRYDGAVAIRCSRDGSDAVVAVQDTGCGMDPAFVQERLFKPFDSTKGSGMGIGAYESREYVRELGGSVEVESEPGRGTRFTIRIPAVGMESAEGAGA